MITSHHLITIILVFLFFLNAHGLRFKQKRLQNNVLNFDKKHKNENFLLKAIHSSSNNNSNNHKNNNRSTNNNNNNNNNNKNNNSRSKSNKSKKTRSIFKHHSNDVNQPIANHHLINHVTPNEHSSTKHSCQWIRSTDHLYNQVPFKNLQVFGGHGPRSKKHHKLHSRRRRHQQKLLKKFYDKYTEAYGIPVLGPRTAPDSALKRACYVLRFLLADRSDLRKAFQRKGGRMVVLGKNHFIADLPEYKLFLQQQKHHPQQQRVKQILKRFKNVPSNKIVPITTTTEENLLCYKNFSNQVTEVNFVEDVFSNNQSSIPSFQHHKRNNNSSYKIIDHNHNRLRYENEPHSSRPICRYHYKPHHHNHKSNHQKLSHKSSHHKFSHNGHKSGHHSSKSDQKTQHSQQHQQRHKHHHKSQKTSKSRKQDSHQRHLANHKLPCVPPRRAHLSRDDITLKSLAIGILNIAVSHSNPSLLRRLEKAYKHALLTGLWLNTDAATDVQSYFGEGVQSYYNANAYARPANGFNNEVNTRVKLKSHDPELYAIVHEVFPCANNYVKRCGSRGNEAKLLFEMDCPIHRWKEK